MLKYFIKSITTNYAKFSGRATRKEFLSSIFGIFALYFLTIILFRIDNKDDAEALGGLFFLIFTCPVFAVWSRRLHDLGLSGWSQDLWKSFFLKGSNEENKYGKREIEEKFDKKTIKNIFKFVVGFIVLVGLISFIDDDKPAKAGVPKCWDKDIKKQLLDRTIKDLCSGNLFENKDLSYLFAFNLSASIDDKNSDNVDIMDEVEKFLSECPKNTSVDYNTFSFKLPKKYPLILDVVKFGKIEEEYFWGDIRECKYSLIVKLSDQILEPSFDYKIKKVKTENGIEYRIEEGDDTKFDRIMNNLGSNFD